MQLDSIDVHKVAGNLKDSSIDELTAASKKGKEQFAYMRPDDTRYDQLKADLIAIDAELGASPRSGTNWLRRNKPWPRLPMWPTVPLLMTR